MSDVWQDKGSAAHTSQALHSMLKHEIEKLACMQVKCSWLLPMAVTDVAYTPVTDTDFRSAKKLKQKLDQNINNLTTS